MGGHVIRQTARNSRPPNESAATETARLALLEKDHFALQKLIALIVGPAGTALYLWQWRARLDVGSLILLAAFIATYLCWILALLLRRRISIYTSIYLYCIPPIIDQGLQIVVQPGTETASVLTFVCVAAYMGLYSTRIATVGIVLSLGFILLAEGSRWLLASGYPQVWMLPPYEANHRIFTQTFFALLILYLIRVVFQKNQYISKQLLSQIETVNQRRATVLSGIRQMQPAVERAVSDVSSISNDFVQQSADHSTRLNAAAATVNSIGMSAKRSAETAEQTSKLTADVRVEAEEGRTELMQVLDEFSTVKSLIEQVNTELSALSLMAENISEFLDGNRQIASHIKVLSVNAALEASSAGAAGRGFLVVANELNELMDSTEENLSRSTEILSRIQHDAKQNAFKIRNGTAMLNDSFSKLNGTIHRVAKIVEGFSKVAEEIGVTADAAARQNEEIEEVDKLLTSLQEAAVRMEYGSRSLMKSMSDLVASNETLEKAIQEPGAQLSSEGTAPR